MMDAEQIRFIRNEIKKSLNILLNAAAGDNDSMTETIETLFPGMPGIASRPVMHPYGFASRAPAGMISVVGSVGNNQDNRMVMGHRAKDRPADLNNGETVLYSADGNAIYVRNGKIQIGSSTSGSPMVLGDVLLNALTDIVNAFLNATDAVQTPMGPGFLDPAVRNALITALKTYVQTTSTNVVSQVAFTERGSSE